MPRKKSSSTKKDVEDKSNFLKKYSKFLIIIGLAVSIGLIHGIYAVAQNSTQHQYISGSDICNGEYLSGKIKVTSLDTRLMMNYKVLVAYGSMNMVLRDPTGNIAFNKTDSNPIFRQHSVLIDDDSEIGTWEYVLSCDRADMEYEVTIDVEATPDYSSYNDTDVLSTDDV